jgi:regulator of sigma E protease
MQVLANIPAFLFVLGVIIFVHEFGHFITAKAFGMKVFIFSFGFGRRLFGFKWGGTDCRVSLVPLGGYVKLEGEPDDHLSEAGPNDVRLLDDGTLVRVDSPHYFLNRPRWQRFVVYLAGPVMNAALTIAVMTVFHMRGFGQDPTLQGAAVVGYVAPAGSAAEAGLAPGDEITAIDGEAVRTWEAAFLKILLRPDTTVKLRVRRAGEEREVAVRSSATGKERAGTLDIGPLVRIDSVAAKSAAEAAGLRPGDGVLTVGGEAIRTFSDISPIVQRSANRPLAVVLYRAGQVLEVTVTPRDDGEGPKLGILSNPVIRQFGFLRAVKESVVWTWGQVDFTFRTIGRLLTGGLSPKSMMGPLGIAQASGEKAREGVASLFFLIAVVSLQVGILNLFPLAPLDGGHLAILAAEGLVRRDLSMVVKAWIMNAGVVALFLLIGLVLYSDLSKTSLLGRYLP